jgi:hypothetical protein
MEGLAVIARMLCADSPALRESTALRCGRPRNTPPEAAAGMGRMADAGRGQRRLGEGACVLAGAGANRRAAHELRKLNQEAEPRQSHGDEEGLQCELRCPKPFGE